MTALILVSSLLIAAGWQAPGAGPAVISGEVVDAGGRPVADAAITVLPEYKGALDVRRIPLPGRASVRTDAAGHFSVQASPGRVAVVAIVAGSDLLARAVPLEVGPRGARVRVRLDQGVELDGLVRDAKDHPVADVQITARPDPDEEGSLSGDATLARTTTRPDGTFRLAGLRPGAYRLTVKCEVGGTAGLPVRTDMSPILVPVVRGQWISGRVFRGDDHRAATPIREFHVESKGFPGLTVRSEDGSFEIPVKMAWKGLPVIISAPGLASTMLRFDLPAGEEFILGNVVLTPGRSVRGRVVDSAGHPVAGAVARLGVAGWGTDALATSDDSGRLDLPQVSSGDILLSISHLGLQTEDLRLPASRDEFEVRLSPGATVVVRVENAEGRPVAGAEVDTLVLAPCVTDAAGSCVFTGLAPGLKVFALLHPPGEGTPKVSQMQVNVGAGSTVALRYRIPREPSRLQLALAPPDRRGQTAWLVVIPGEVPAGLELGPLLAGAPPHYADGFDGVKNLPPDRYTVLAYDQSTPPRCALKVIDLPEGADQTITVELPRTPGPCR